MSIRILTESERETLLEALQTARDNYQFDHLEQKENEARALFDLLIGADTINVTSETADWIEAPQG